MGQVPRDRRDGFLPRSRGQSVRHSQFRPSYAHAAGCPAQCHVRRRRIRGDHTPGGHPGSPSLPRRAALCRPPQGGARQDRAQRLRDGRPRHPRRHRDGDNRPGFRLHGRLARHGRRRGHHHRHADRRRAPHAFRAVCLLGRRAHAGGHPLPHAAAAHDGGGPGAPPRRPALYRGADPSHHRRRHRLLRHARRRPARRAWCPHRLRRSAGHRADHPREAARRLPARRIPARAWHGRHGRSPPPDARDRRPDDQAPDEESAGQARAGNRGGGRADGAIGERGGRRGRRPVKDRVPWR